jgi:pyruvate-ferredoxin/flavodoxin oxidoreductase
LFEDNAEFGFGMRLTVDKFNEFALELVDKIIGGACGDAKIDKDLLAAIKAADQSGQSGIEDQRARVAVLKTQLNACPCDLCAQLASLADYLVKKSVWIIGGDGWAYDIGYGGLDHVLASGKNIKVLVVDTEVYSNTGGQASKSTPMGAVAKFAAGGKPTMKKDLGMISMTYGNIYVAQVALGANPGQCVKAFMEAEQYDGPAIIIAYSHCIAHGIDMNSGMQGQKDAVNSAHFPLYRFNPELTEQGKNPLSLDSKPPTMTFSEHAMKENRFRVLKQMNPDHATKLMAIVDKKILAKYDMLTKLAGMEPCSGSIAPKA